MANRLTVTIEGEPTVDVDLLIDGSFDPALFVLPRPFVKRPHDGRSNACLNVEVVPLTSARPSRRSVLGSFRSGEDEPYLWLIEDRSGDLVSVWIDDEVSGEVAHVISQRRDKRMTVCVAEWPGKWLIRLLKNFFGVRLRERGWIVFHAAAVVEPVRRRAVIITGAKGYGKSSFTLLACVRNGASFLSDDMIMARSGDNGTWTLIGWPNRVGFRKSLLEAVQGSAATKVLGRELRRGTLPPDGHPRGERLGFEHDELTSYLAIAVEGMYRGPISVVLLEEPTARGRGFIGEAQVEPLPSEILADRYLARYLTDPLGLFPSASAPAGDLPLPMVRLRRCRLPFDVSAGYADCWKAVVGE